MMWFKIDKDFYTRSVPGGKPPQIMYLFSFEDSVACFFTDTLTLMCDSWDRRKLQIPANQVNPGIWYHLTLSCSAAGESYLLIQDGHSKEIASDSVRNFGFRQNTYYGWKACIGDCTSDYGFFGGVREVLFMTNAVTREEASRAKNMIFTYDSSIKAYFRFQDHFNKFEKDEFVDWPWLAFKNKPGRRENYIGVDIIPNDVCPSLFEQISSLHFTDSNQLDEFDIDTNLVQRQYQYTMSMTIQLNETACVSSDSSVAAEDCNLVKLDGVFMMYLMGRNTGRFFFFANKNYYESVSTPFYLPYDQWITIQMTLEHYNGFTIVISDQNGNAFYRTKVSRNMQEQWPTQKLTLFRSLEGYAEHFYLTNTYQALDPSYAVNFRDKTDSLVNMFFNENEYLKDSKTFVNRGGLGGSIGLQGEESFEDVFFAVPAEGTSVLGTLADTRIIFDGIACNDRHMTTHLDSADSFISFYTPPLQEWASENTIEFWFKVEDPAVYTQDVLLFSMVSQESNPQLYYHVYIQDGYLKCAPFGTTSNKDPVMAFTKFTKENEDTYGWWHISCSYNFQKEAKAMLYNTNVFQVLEETMAGLPKFYPTNSLLASFGDGANTDSFLPGASNVMLKEFRYWNKQLNAAEIANNRYRQIDPTKIEANLLLIYLRFATGSTNIDNFASRNSAYSFDDLDLNTGGLSFVEDFIETEKYTYDAQLDLVVSQSLRTYHTVCPVHTYYMKQYCYNEPVNKAVLAIFPIWNEATGDLNWDMTLVHSSLINTDVIRFLSDAWGSDDTILNAFFERSESTLDHLVPAGILRHEAEYEVQAALSNSELTFLNTATVKFSPSKCKWLTVVGQGVSEGYTQFQVSPGTEDITFQLELKRNPALDCSSFDFFDSFSGLDFEFLMTNTADYISYSPKMEVTARDATGQEIVLGERTPDTMFIDVTLPMLEQEKMPVFQDISILLTVHWTSSEYATPELTKDIVFQNLLYTIKFEPTENVLTADLVASLSDIIRGETLILDASNSFISNMPEIQQRRSLAYSWECPPVLAAFCATRAGTQLSIPFSQVEKTDLIYEKPYEFSVTVIWAKPDGVDEFATLSVQATWYDLVIPSFNIDYDPTQTLITAPKDSLFYLEALNFAIDEIIQYDVVWAIYPELADPSMATVLSGGRVFQILKGAYSENTDYEVSLSVTHKTLAKLIQVKTVSFQTLAPPVAGTVSVSPLVGFIGDEFTVTLKDWTSANLPIEYNVYSTFDNSGARKGLIINEDGPIPLDEALTFVAGRTTPIIVAVFDKSGETIEYTLKPEISLAPEPEPVPEPADPSADGDVVVTDPAEEDTENGDVEVSNGESSSADDVADTRTLISKIQATRNLSQRVNYMNIAIETVQRTDYEQATMTQAQIAENTEFRMELITEIEKQVIDFENDEVEENRWQISPRDFLKESFGMLAQLSANPRYINQNIVDKCVQLIHRLVNMQSEDSLFILTLEAETAGNFRSDYFTSLENLNKFARINSVERTLLWVRLQLEDAMDKMCSFVGLPEVYAYNSDVGELGFSLFKFDHQSALKSRRGTLQALDATFDYNAYAMYNWFTTSQPGELCAQVYGQQFGTILMDGAYKGNSKARLQATIYELGSATRYSMGELSGQNIATFAIDRDTYHSDQTICMGYSKSTNKWQGDLCKSELSVEDVTMKCVCNAFDSNLVSVMTDYTRVLGQPVEFPALPVKPNQLAVVPSSVDPALVDSTVDRQDQTGIVSKVSDVSGTNYVWMGQTILIAILTLAGSVMARRLDTKDEASQSVARTSPIAVAKQNHFVDEIARELNEPYAQVCFRKQSLFYYRTIYGKSAFPHLMSQLHPLISPFTSYYATQGRFTRFTLYMLQVNIITSFIFIYYSAVYRQNDPTRDSDVIDQSDILSVLLATGVGSLLLTPWLSEPLIKACSNKLVASAFVNTTNITQPVLLKPRRVALRTTLLIFSVATSVALPVWAIAASASIPASSQYCMSTTVLGSLFGATIGTNLIYLWINSCLARKVAYAANKRQASTCQCLVHVKALQIVRDMKAVCEIKGQFTLADVLPSSLECSEQSCSHRSAHSSAAGHGSVNSEQHLRLPPISEERTVNDDDQHVIELIDEAEQRRPACLVREEGKDLMTDDMNEHSMRGLRPTALASGPVGNESQKDLLASMLKDSFLDFDNSRNCVVPQRTLIEDNFASIHPEGAEGSEGPSSQSSVSEDRGAENVVDPSDDESRGEDDEAFAVRVGRERVRSEAQVDIPLNVDRSKVILQ